MGVIRKLDRQGDTETHWDPTDRKQVAEAHQLFDSHIRRGGLAYEVGNPREPAEVIRKFNLKAKEIILAPRMVGG